jgi:hypothetical protein
LPFGCGGHHFGLVVNDIFPDCSLNDFDVSQYKHQTREQAALQKSWIVERMESEDFFFNPNAQLYLVAWSTKMRV